MSLMLLLALVCGCGLAWYLMDIREQALQAAQRHCDQVDVQFLDGSVARNGFGFPRNGAGTVVLLQRFTFEFATGGDQRYQGEIDMIGKKVVRLQLEAHRW